MVGFGGFGWCWWIVAIWLDTPAGVLSGGGGSGQALALRFVNVMIELVFIFSFFLDWFFLFNCLEWRNFIETT